MKNQRVSLIIRKCYLQIHLENQQEPTQVPVPSSKSTESDDSTTDYDKLLDQLDEEKDEDVIERVLQRYGLKYVHIIHFCSPVLRKLTLNSVGTTLNMLSRKPSTTIQWIFH